MRHKVAGKKLGRTTSHRIAMTRNMASSLIEHERIITTVQKAKNLRPFVEKLITLAKDPSLHHRRQVFARLRNEDATAKLMEILGPRFKERPGGYTRILKLAKPRLGDNGQRAIIELVERTVDEDAPVVESEETAEATA